MGYVNRPRKSNPPDSDVGAGMKDHEGGRHGARRCESTSLGRMDLPDPWCDVTGGGEPTSIPGQCDDSLGTTPGARDGERDHGQDVEPRHPLHHTKGSELRSTDDQELAEESDTLFPDTGKQYEPEDQEKTSQHVSKSVMPTEVERPHGGTYVASGHIAPLRL